MGCSANTNPETKAATGWLRLVGDCLVLLASLSPALAADTPDSSPRFAEYKRMTLEELLDVEVVSVSRRPEQLSESASAVQVITRDEIRRSGATNIPEALRLATNLAVAQKNSHAWAITARGFNTDLANKLLVLIDGRTVYTPLFSGVFWDVQDYLLEDIDRIEVISGPGGTLWGANAVNGVINIITRSAAETQGSYAQVAGGTEMKTLIEARHGGEFNPDAAFRVYGKYFDRDNTVAGDGTDVTDSWNMGRAGFRIDVETSARDHWTLQGDVYSGDEDLDTGGTYEVDGGNLIGRWSRTLSDESALSLQVYYDRAHLTQPTPELVINGIVFAPAGTFRDDLDTYDLDFQHRFGLGRRHLVVWGLGYRYTHDVVTNSPSLAFFPSVLDQRLYSAFVLDEVRIRRNVFLTVGSKIEHTDYTGTEYEPSLRLQWNVAANQMLWAAVSRAVRTPSRIDRDLSQPAPPFLVVLAGGANFESESLLAYEAGYRGQIGAKCTMSSSTYYNDYDDLRSTSTTPGTILPFFFENNLTAETWGVELAGACQVQDRWRLRAGYDFLHEHLRVKPGHTDFNDALNETSDPEHQVSLQSYLNPSRNLELYGGLRWVDTLRNNNGPQPGTVPSYVELDLRVGWLVNQGLELSLVGKNLLHDHHPEYGFPGPDRKEIERGVWATASYRW